MSGALDGYPTVAPALRRPIIFDQAWRSLAFLHWPVRPEQVTALFPPGTRPDVFDDGFTYVGLVPFEMSDAAFVAGWKVPYFGHFLETNIRLYSVDDAGRHGVLFRSLDTTRLAIVALARAAFAIPYTWARMTMRRDEDVVRYDCERRVPHRGLRSHVALRIGDLVPASDLETWLTARWGAHTRAFGRTVWLPNEHEPWPLHSAQVLDLRDDLLGASGVPVAGPPLRALWSPGVHTRFGRPVVLPEHRIAR